MSIKRLLVANRGEIARRVFRTCRELGIGTVAVHSDPDATAAFVHEADLAVRLPGSAPSETYLRADLVIEAAQRAGADAVHPGYGFLSENADFARQVLKAGLTWVGPTPESIEAMGSKVESKRLMSEAGVPTLDNLDPDAVTEGDLPVLVKASAGGGGRGMRVVRELSELAATVESAAAEAASAFGDGTVFVEPYVERGRHLEVQIWGDHGGTTVSVLGVRECSVQRRHQKVVEEAPAYNLSQSRDIAAELGEAARKAGEAIGYVGAGTVEFLYDDVTERFYFLEMNTRLQVEHPVTELTAGVDLVRLQLAAAEDPSVREVEVAVDGHAIEVRLYAEDPAHDYQPQSGTLTRFEIPGVAARFDSLGRAGIRLDSAVRAGDEIGTSYDAMIAKVISWAPTRTEAARRLAAALEAAEIHGLRTNRDLLVEVLRHPRFLAGEATTSFLASEPLMSIAPADGDLDLATTLAGFAAAVAHAHQRRTASQVLPGVPAGWRNVFSAPDAVGFDCVDVATGEVSVAWQWGRDGEVLVEGPGQGAVVERVEQADDHWLVVVGHAGVSLPHRVHLAGEAADVEGPHGHTALSRRPRFVDPADQVAEGSLLAPMPGSVIAVRAEAGQEVSLGQPVLVLEAMKMQHTIAAPHDGVVTDLPVAVGTQVNAGDVLAIVEAAEATTEETEH